MKRLVLTAAAVLSILAAGTVSATQPDENGEHKVQLCHRTASDSNPYVLIEVDVASLDAHLNNLPGHPAKTNEDGSPRNDYLYTEQTPCVALATPTPPSDDPDPEPTPTASPSPVPSPSPTVGPSDGPSTEPSTTPSRGPLPQTDTESPAPASGPMSLLFLLFFSAFAGTALYLNYGRRR